MLELSTEQQKVLEHLKKGKNVLLTGQAGTGKTTTLQAVRNYAIANKLNFGITAMTGCAAILIRGRTLHSFLGIGLGTRAASTMAAYTITKNKLLCKRIMSLQLLVIDEISMMNAELFTKINDYLCHVRGNKKPFGGVQVLLCGDFAQLPPVEGDFCFESPDWNPMNIETVVLSFQFRQESDTMFQDMLQRCRIGACTYEDIQALKRCKDTIFADGIQPTRIYPKNRNVDQINQHELSKLLGEGKQKVIYRVKYVPYSLPINHLQAYASTAGIPEVLELCEGAQVIVTSNLSETVVNGTRGKIISLSSAAVVIRTTDGCEEVIPLTSVAPFDDHGHDEIIYMPFRLGYAISIHKSQGMTLDAVEMDLGKDIFEYGQAYVALSRAKRISNIRITNVKASSFQMHPKVRKFYEESL
jgi:ATP-dependent DNA helicase PIF1